MPLSLISLLQEVILLIIFIDMSLSRKCLLINKIYVKQLIGELNWFLIIHLHQNLAQKNEPLI
jgi:hypothetical protein